MTESKSGRVYDEKVRRQAVRILKDGAGHRALASKLGIPEATARQWARAYAVGGADAVMNAGKTHRVYSYELKLAAVQDRVDNGMTVREVMVKYGIPSESSIKTWCRQYKKDGPEALRNKPRGVKPKKDAEPAEGAEKGLQPADGAEAVGASEGVAAGEPPKAPEDTEVFEAPEGFGDAE